ncbi:NAD-dependent epimerase/dehydratase family protein [Ornithinimicrobium humiphilum]|uniref:Nucleoside-diphosphate-sugar epimerase n=1 Tax=Ornithinimicrobium humiphilum TaxID=125288 RepID=A0A543K850_9MICO|nr:NAD-dependent epimerase/dehydratase family protein [Ornithinimicrobium humiphilum]TQM91266.1 nucleoside-diphosphate-sugar epimerase [Ornithinimicrobium humiphilum]
MTSANILVTGAAGFIGSTLCQRLLDDGYSVTGVDSFTDYYSPELKQANARELLRNPAFKFLEEDVNVLTRDVSKFEGLDHIVHLAGQPGVRASWGSEFDLYTHANVSATQRLLEVARALPDLKSFVYASSSSVYGNAATFPSSEAGTTQPFSPYGVTKLAGEHLASLYASNFGVPTRSLRFFTVYGPRQRPDMAFTKFFRHILDGTPIPVYGDGTQLREFTFVDDVVDAVHRATVLPLTPGTVMNVSGGSTVSLKDVISLLKTDLSLDFDVRTLPSIAGDVRRTGGTTDVIRNLTGWRPLVPLADGLAKQWCWAQQTHKDGIHA